MTPSNFSSFLSLTLALAWVNPNTGLAQYSIPELYEAADVVVQGRITSDTVYEAAGWVYTSYIIEPCMLLKDSGAEQVKPMVITRTGGMLDGIDYSRPDGLYIFGGEQAVFFLDVLLNDTITPEGYISVVPTHGHSGFARYLTDDWRPEVAVGDSNYTAANLNMP